MNDRSAFAQRYKIIVAYDGTDFVGWQQQPCGKDIASTLQAGYARAFKETIAILGASRTDAGVHAAGQVAAFTARACLPEERLLWVWNRSLPMSLSVRSIEAVDSDFNPRAYVLQKEYHYHFFVDRPLPFMYRFGYSVPGKIDMTKLQEALHCFVGTHNFRSFCTGDDLHGTLRTIDALQIDYNPALGAYQIVIKGKGFLRYMIRRIVGASMQVALGQKSIEQIKKALAIPDARQDLFTAPAAGLMLYNIIYEKDRP